MKTYTGPGILVTTPEDWEDISDEEGLIPFLTLAREEGIGALQFSDQIGGHDRQSGASAQALWDRVGEWGTRYRMGASKDVVIVEEPMLLAAATFHPDGEPMRVWLVSDRVNAAFIVYTCDGISFDALEIEECEAIVRTIRFTT
jgi:hypothetical protein